MTVSSETLLEMTPIMPIVEIVNVDMDAAMPLAEALSRAESLFWRSWLHEPQ